jgi:iron complex outermembrane receptor protein
MCREVIAGALLLCFPAGAAAQEAEDVGGGEIGEVSVYGRERVSPLRVLTTEPPAWESSVTSICPEDVPGACNLFEALKYSTNGLASTQGRRKKHYYLLRGQNVASDYAVNGVSLSTNGAGPMAEWVEAPTLIPTAMIEGVEVIRSGNSLLLGFSGLNGVVNVRTRRFDYATTQAEADYGSFRSLHYGALHGNRIGNVHYAASLEHDRTEGPSGRHSFEDMWKFYAKVDYCLGETFEASVENMYVYGVRHVTQAVWDSLAAPQSQLADVWEYDPMRYDVATARLKWRPTERLSTELQGSMILNRMDLYPDKYAYRSTGRTIELSDSIARQRMLDEPDTIYTAALFQGFSPMAGNVARRGVMYASSTTYAHGRSHRSIVSGALLDQHAFGTVDVHAGVKVIRERYGAEEGGGAWLVNVSGGVSYRPASRHTFNAVLNSGTLPADRTELTESGERLRQEVRTGMELGWEPATAAGRPVLTLFFMDQRNTSEYTRKPYYDERGVLRYYMRNLNLLTGGVELSFRTRREGVVAGFANASLKYVSEQGAGYRRRYARQPPFIANAGVNFFLGAADVCLTAKYVSGYRTDRFLKEEVGVGNYCNVDVHARYRLHRFVELYANVSNVADVRYATVSPLYPDFGRAWRLGLRCIY